jgi:hypothetical protein
MKNKELKVLWKVARPTWIGGTLIWIIETAIFLLYEGWHLKATHPIEIWFDKLVGVMWNFALYLTVFICVQYIFNLNRNRLKKTKT